MFNNLLNIKSNSIFVYFSRNVTLLRAMMLQNVLKTANKQNQKNLQRTVPIGEVSSNVALGNR